MPNKKISQLSDAAALTGGEHLEILQGGANLKTTAQDIADLAGSGVTRDVNRVWTQTLLFDKHEINYAPHVLTGDVTYSPAVSGHLVNEFSSAIQTITLDGIVSINFSGFDYIYGITNGEVPPAGQYQILFLYLNGTVTANWPGVSAESSSAIVLAAPNNFVAAPASVPNNETELVLTWDNVTNNQGYYIEFSLTGTGGWTELTTTAVDAVTASQTGLSAGNTRYYQIKTLGDGVNYLDSAFSTIISGQTESSGDVTAPTFIFVPANGNAVWTVNSSVVITANEPIRNTDGSEITNANVASRITLKETNSGGANIAFTATIDGTKQIITVTPTTQYGENQLVYVAINNVEDVNGNEVTVAVSITFTTTEYTNFNGTTNRVQFGDILDSLFAANDTNFWLELTVNNVLGSGIRPLVTKYDTAGNQRSFQWYISGADIYFGTVAFTNGVGSRVIKWTNVLTAGEHTLVLKQDMSIDTNDGLDRATLLIDTVDQVASKSLFNSGEALQQFIANGTAQLAVGAFINAAGNPVGSSFFASEAKDFIIRSAAGSVVEINVPNLKLGTDTSGNARHGSYI